MDITLPALIKAPGWSRLLERKVRDREKMSVLDDLIKIKTNEQGDGLITMLDEIPVYQKLSVNKQFVDLKTSEITRKKCPMLAAFADGKLYETVLAELCANIYLQIEGRIPQCLRSSIERTPRQQKQFEILQKGVAEVHYDDISNYYHEEMKDHVVAVFIDRHEAAATAVVIVKGLRGYTMYHGTYTTGQVKQAIISAEAPLVYKGEKGTLTMSGYSMLGNNGYPFAHYTGNHADYDVMLDPQGILYLVKGADIIPYEIPHMDRNILNIAKNDPTEFIKDVTKIVERVV